MKPLSKMVLFLCLAVLASCGGSGGSSKKSHNENSEAQGAIMPVDWDSVSKEFNPEIFEEEFTTTNLNYLNLRVLGIEDEVKVILASGLGNVGKLKIYRVWKGSGNFGRVELNASFDRLKVENYTNNQPYSCSMSISNRRLESVDGGCNLFVEVILPASSEIEVYSGSKLVSKRFFPMTVDQLIKDVSRGFNEQKLEVIQSFLTSYQQTGKTPRLSSMELEEILEEFTSAGSEKFSALRNLHVYVNDRENLNKVIENTFSFSSDKEKARRIVGI